MYKLLILVFLTLVGANAYNLELTQGQIKAHTEIFGDRQINPTSNEVFSTLSVGNNLESIRGEIRINSLSLKSKKEDRDKNMYEVLNVKIHSNILFQIKTITKIEDGYKISGNLTLNGVKKAILSITRINERNRQLNLVGKFSINLTDYNMEPPTMFFVTVRDQIDITYNLTYNKENK